MTTTSLKLPDDVKQSAITAAERAGISPHAFMVDAIRNAARAAELSAEFAAEALEARAEMLKSGMGYDAEEVHTYFLNRVSGKPAKRPKAKSWRS
jgi:predicted transcriptional regulator